MGLRRRYRDHQKQKARFLEYHGVDVPLDGPHVAQIVRDALFGNVYEIPEIEAAEQIVRPGDRILELGTGMGIVTAILARAAGEAGLVRTYEANPEMIAPAAELFRRNAIGNVEARHGVLVPSDPGVRRFNFAEYFPEGSLREPGSKTGDVEVPAYGLKEAMDDFRPDVFICDIEGAEAEIVPALDTSGLRAAVVELHPAHLTDAEIKAIYDHMLADGLYPRIEYSGGTVVAFERIQTP